MLLLPTLAESAEVSVTNPAELRAALAKAVPGSHIMLAPGAYGGGFVVSKLQGTSSQRILITAKDPARRPVFQGGKQAFHFSDCCYFTLRGLQVRECSENGINVDDGASFETPSRGIVVEDVLFEQIGPTGNVDALKLSGVDDFTVRNSTFRGWGGSAIDMVGCHNGSIESCTFEGRTGHSQDSGVQMKGGSSDIRVVSSRFSNAGQRPVNLGGSTGLQYFRPKVGTFEAARIEIAGNQFIGGECAIAMVTAQEFHVHHNTIYRPRRWVFRILQEAGGAASFSPCSHGVIEDNLVVVDGGLNATVNVGPGTAPETFTFRRNAWYGDGVPYTPLLPVPEAGTIRGVVPQLIATQASGLEVKSNDTRLSSTGAAAYVKNLPKQ